MATLFRKGKTTINIRAKCYGLKKNLSRKKSETVTNHTNAPASAL